MPAYDAVRFSPPAPLAAVELRDAATGKTWPNVPMLLDTGADVTLLPRECVNRLELTIDPANVYELMGFDGTRTKAVAVYLDLIFVGLRFRGRFLLIDQPEGILGRDILNHLNVSFHGPRLLWEAIS
jgi:hypothetical protein